MLTREPETVSLSDHSIARDAPTSFSAIMRAVSPESQRRVSTAIRRLSQCAVMPNPESHRLSTPSWSASASRRRLFRSEPSLDLRKERCVGN